MLRPTTSMPPDAFQVWVWVAVADSAPLTYRDIWWAPASYTATRCVHTPGWAAAPTAAALALVRLSVSYISKDQSPSAVSSTRNARPAVPSWDTTPRSVGGVPGGSGLAQTLTEKLLVASTLCGRLIAVPPASRTARSFGSGMEAWPATQSGVVPATTPSWAVTLPLRSPSNFQVPTATLSRVTSAWTSAADSTLL